MVPPLLNDRLANALLIGEAEKIEQIYQELFPKVCKYIVSNGGGEEDAKDVFQKGLLQLSLRLRAGRVKINSSFEGYFFTICKNLWKREQKKTERRVTNENVLPLQDEAVELAQSALEQEKWELFHEYMESLAENCKRLLKRFFSKEPYQKVAQEFGYATENVVRQRIFKCKKKLKELIQKDSRYNELRSHE